MARLNWERMRRQARAAAAERSRTRPPPTRRPKAWRIFLAPRPPLAPPQGLGFHRFPRCWMAEFTNRDAATAAIKRLRAAGWHGRATRSAPDRRTPGTQDRVATDGTINDRPA